METTHTAKMEALPPWKRAVLRLIGVPVMEGVWDVRFGPDGKPAVLVKRLEPGNVRPVGACSMPEHETP